MKVFDRSRFRTIAIAAVLVGLGELLIIGVEPSAERTLAVKSLAWLIQYAVTTLLGGLIGTLIAGITSKNKRLSSAMVDFLRVGRWLPVLALWTTLSVSTVGLIALTATSFYYSLARMYLSTIVEEQAGKSLMIRDIVLHGLLVSLLIHVLEPSGFPWFAVLEPLGEPRALITLGLVAAIIWLQANTIKLNFEVAANAYLKMLEGSDSQPHLKGLRSNVIIVIACITLWLGLSLVGSHKNSSHLSIVREAASMRLDGGGENLFYDIGMSLLEIFGGLTLALAIAVMLVQILSKFKARDLVYRFVPYTYLLPLILMPVLLKYDVMSGIWLSMSAVTVLSFFPCLQLLVGSGLMPSSYRVFVAVSDALPHAFIGMMFGETIHSYSGLGFALLRSQQPGNNRAVLSHDFGTRKAG